MRTFTSPAIDASIVERCRTTLYAWVTDVLVWLAAALDDVPGAYRRHPLIRAAFAETEAGIAKNLRLWVKILRRMLTVAAAARFRPARARIWRRRFPRGVAPGMRRSALNRAVRRVTCGIISGMHQGSLKQRAVRLRRALDRFEALIARALARFVKAWRCGATGALVISAPQRDAILAAEMVAPAYADSS